ncbi:FBD-associated F-box protein [Raphanus sativus]|nr:FBD-associated F-box protein [Raphanus sativus]
MNNSEVLKANIDVILKRPEKLLHSLASIVHIRLCLSDSEVVYPHGCCFHRLKYLECHPAINPHHHQSNQPVSVPRCLSSNLEIFEWIKYEGTQHERELSTYILKTAVFLKKASFTARSDGYKEKLQMLQELSFSRRASSTCELVFN